MSLSDFTTFEIEQLMELGDKYALPVLLYSFRRIETSLTGQPAVIIIDEAILTVISKEALESWQQEQKEITHLVVVSHNRESLDKNTGSIIKSGNNTTILAQNDITNEGNITGGNNVALTSNNGGIINNQGKIKSDNNLSVNNKSNGDKKVSKKGSLGELSEGL